MRVSLKSNLHLGEEVVEIEEGATLRSLLKQLSQKVSLLDPERLRGWVVISLNGQECELLSFGLDSSLSSDDEVEIAIAGFGGG